MEPDLNKKDKITELIQNWFKAGNEIKIERGFSTKQSQIKEGELDITLIQRQNLRIYWDEKLNRWSPLIGAKINFFTISISDKHIPFENDVYFLKKAFEWLDIQLIEKREKVLKEYFLKS